MASANAQVPNGGFENWTITPEGYEDLDDWITVNAFTTLAGVPPSCLKETPGAEGSYYATLTTRNTFIGPIAGLITLGDVASGVPGFPYTGRPAALTGQWQYGIQPTDSGHVAVIFTKWNGVAQTSETVGFGDLGCSGASPNAWQAFSVPVLYVLPDDPDSAFVIISPSMNSPVAGSFIKIDALAFEGTVAVGGRSASPDLALFPSPANEVLHVHARIPINELQVVAMDGRIAMHRKVDANAFDLGVAQLQTGSYMLRINWKDGTRTVRTFLKQ